MDRRTFLKSVPALTLLAAAKSSYAEPRKEAAFPIKIGLLADSQITSQNGFSNFSFRSKFAKAMVNVAIRPPAIEGYLAEEMLQVALNKLTQDPHGDKKGVDVILYLGDAANSGGADEIDTVLTVLARHGGGTESHFHCIHRKCVRVDYILGAGNIVSYAEDTVYSSF